MEDKIITEGKKLGRYRYEKDSNSTEPSKNAANLGGELQGLGIHRVTELDQKLAACSDNRIIIIIITIIIIIWSRQCLGR